MPAQTDPKAKSKSSNTRDVIGSYLAGWDDDDDPFKTPPRDSDRQSASNQRKEPQGDILGADKLLDGRAARAPAVKLDEKRLLSDKGIPKLRKTAPQVRLKGKGHEFSDAARLLSFYQLWLDDLYPKATFLDALAMVEKAGHKSSMHKMRQQWIDEGKPKADVAADGEDDGELPTLDQQQAAVDEDRPKTPVRDGPGGGDDLFGDDDLYDATPLAQRNIPAPGGATADADVARPSGGGDDIPDDDDLDALMAEDDARTGAQNNSASGGGFPPMTSLFGDGPKRPQAAATGGGVPDDDDMDALMAEAEAGLSTSKPAALGPQPVISSIFGGGGRNAAQPTLQRSAAEEPDADDLDALMAEAEADHEPAADEDDLDMLMAEGKDAAERPPLTKQ